MQFKQIVTAAVALLLTIAPASAQLAGENLVSRVPDGYDVVLTETKENNSIVKMVPRGETLDDWRDMLTVRVLRTSTDSHLEARRKMLVSWALICEQSRVTPISSGTENGYPFTADLFECARSAQMSEPTSIITKNIRGQVALYTIQKTFKGEITERDIINWTRYLRQVVLCDNRSEERACPHQ